mmetsp:Transcript_4452/g.16251  ORF Transcript_4452/g.16251 Transcript_4452/m.16251 type:complete len:264 (-) Transcript_4452:851-1642(-)
MTSAMAPGPTAEKRRMIQAVKLPAPGHSELTVCPAPTAFTASARAHRPYRPPRMIVFHAWILTESPPFSMMQVRRKMYMDQLKAPARQKASPMLIPPRVPAAAAAAAEDSAEARVTTPIRARRQPNQTFLPTLSPPTIATSGVSTTDVCVRNDAREASVKRRPTLSSPCAPRFHIASSDAANQKEEEEAEEEAEEEEEEEAKVKPAEPLSGGKASNAGVGIAGMDSLHKDVQASLGRFSSLMAKGWTNAADTLVGGIERRVVK